MKRTETPNLFDRIYEALQIDFKPSYAEPDLQFLIEKKLDLERAKQREVKLSNVIPLLYLHDKKAEKNPANGAVDFLIDSNSFEMKIITSGSNLENVDNVSEIIDDLFRCALISLDTTKVRIYHSYYLTI